MRRRRTRHRRLIAAALAAGLLAATPAFARPADGHVRAPLAKTQPEPAPRESGPPFWLILVGLTGVAIVAGGTAGPLRIRPA